MMDYDSQLKLQAYLDGELTEAESRDMAKRLAQDQEAVLLLAELRHTREAVRNGQPVVTLPESREFFWSKIQREIARESAPEPAQTRPSWIRSWSRFLVPAGASAAVATVLMMTLISSPHRHMSTALADAGTFTYRDYDSGATLVWVSYPAENEFAEREPVGTVQ